MVYNQTLATIVKVCVWGGGIIELKGEGMHSVGVEGERCLEWNMSALFSSPHLPPIPCNHVILKRYHNYIAFQKRSL